MPCRRSLLAFVIVAALAPATGAHAATCVAQANGSWNANGTWSSCGGSFPAAGDSATIGSFTVTVTAGHSADSLTLAGGTLAFDAGEDLTVTGAFNASTGTVTGDGELDVGGAFTKTTAGQLNLSDSLNLSLGANSTIADGTIAMANVGAFNTTLLELDADLVIGDGNTATTPISGGSNTRLQIYGTGRLIDRRDGAAMTSVITPIENDGEIRAEDGTLQISNSLIGDQSGGAYIATAGNTLNMASNNTVVSPGSLTGAGTISIVDGLTTVGDGADVNPATLRLTGGNLTITGATGAYTATTIEIPQGVLTSSRTPSPQPTSLAVSPTIFAVIAGNQTMIPGTFTKTNPAQFAVSDGADLVLNANTTLHDGSICLSDNGGNDSGLTLNATLTIPAGNSSTGPIPCNSQSDGPLLKITAPNGKIVDQQPGDTNITTPYDNDGEVRAEAGKLTFQNGNAGSQSSGDFVATAGDEIEIMSTASIGGAGASLTGAGTIDFTGGGATIGQGADITPATFSVSGNEFLTISGSGLYTPTTIDFPSANVTSSRDASPTTLNVGAADLSGDHTLTPGTLNKTGVGQMTVRDRADLVLNGTVTWADGAICVTESAAAGDPSLQIGTTVTMPAAVAGPFNCNQGAGDVPHIFVNTGGTLQRAGAGTSSIITRTEVNGGSLPIASGQTLAFNIPLGVTSGTVDVDGTLTGNATLTGGALSGDGTISGLLTNTGGSVRPGSSPGTLDVGTFTQGDSGTLEIEAEGDQAGQFDVLAVSGLATLDGTVALVGQSYEPENDDVIPFLTSGSRSGTFDDLSGGALGGARTWSLDYPAGSPFGARLVVDLPPPPTAGTPTITGTPASGQELTCETGTWPNATDFAFQWLRDGAPLGGATEQTYTVVDDDRGHELTCRVTGSNAAGSAEAPSAPVAMPAPDQPPGDPPPTTTPPATTPPATTPPAPSPPVTTPAPTAQENRLADAAPSAVAQALGFPARACISRRRFTIRLREPAGVRLASARITVAGKRVTARRVAGRLRAVVDLRGLKAGRYAVKIVARTTSGKMLTGTRRYRTCGTKRRAGGVPPL